MAPFWFTSPLKLSSVRMDKPRQSNPSVLPANARELSSASVSKPSLRCLHTSGQALLQRLEEGNASGCSDDHKAQ